MPIEFGKDLTLYLDSFGRILLDVAHAVERCGKMRHEVQPGHYRFRRIAVQQIVSLKVG